MHSIVGILFHPGEIGIEIISFLPLSRKETAFSLCDLCVSSEVGGKKIETTRRYLTAQLELFQKCQGAI